MIIAHDTLDLTVQSPSASHNPLNIGPWGAPLPPSLSPLEQGSSGIPWTYSLVVTSSRHHWRPVLMTFSAGGWYASYWNFPNKDPWNNQFF